MKIAAFNVGPLNNVYSGKHTYVDVFIPFLNELTRQNIEVDWVGITLENKEHNKKLDKLKIYLGYADIISMDSKIKKLNKSWDFIDPSEYDAFICQPRPDICKLENEILFTLINRFLDANKKVFIWELDMFLDGFTDRMKNECILLHPAILPPKKFATEIYFPFFTHSEYEQKIQQSIERDLDFLLIANIYGRNEQAMQFFKPLEDAPFDKLIFGSWIETDARRQFAEQFKNFEFAGNCEFWAANPLMRRAKATLHIVPHFARDRGLMTARVFVSQMNRCLCYCDSKIVGAEKFFPTELIVKDGNEIKERWNSVQEHLEDLLAQRDELLKEHTVEKRVSYFIKLLHE